MNPISATGAAGHTTQEKPLSAKPLCNPQSGGKALTIPGQENDGGSGASRCAVRSGGDNEGRRLAMV